MPFRTPLSSRRPSTLALLAALTAGLCQAGCLEANAAAPDGATEGGPHAKPGADTGAVTPHPDASSTVDTGTKPTMDATVPPGTDSGKADAGMTGIPICTGATSAEVACNTCVETSCTVDVAPALSACGAFYVCYAKCACSDMACINACEMAAPMTCDTPAENLIKCQMSMCATACATPDAGMTIPDTGTPKDGGPMLPLCQDPTSGETSCNDCVESKCSSTASAAITACSKFYSCYVGCACSDTSCITGCEGMAPSSCDTPAENLITCQKSMCATACATTDGGTTTDGGSATIPDCKNPTSAEQTTYASCSACDNSMCTADVRAAVAACTSYYQCIATTDCADALFVCEASLTEACSATITSLTTCQDSNCSTACE